MLEVCRRMHRQAASSHVPVSPSVSRIPVHSKFEVEVEVEVVSVRKLDFECQLQLQIIELAGALSNSNPDSEHPMSTDALTPVWTPT
jgi:hypothetical protein